MIAKQPYSKNAKKTIVVIGNGMVGHRFCEQLIAFDKASEYQIVTFCEEPRAAYDRVGLTSFFAHRDPMKLMLARIEWYREQGIELHIGDRVSAIDRRARVVCSDKGLKVAYDKIVLATGSFPFVPSVPGIQNRGVFVYRTIEDLQQIIAYSEHAKRAAVIGGGLLGLEAAKAAYDLGLETHVIEFAPRLMPRQIDDAGSKILVQKIESLGVKVHLNKATKEVLGQGKVSGLLFNDGAKLDVEMIIVSAGIRPRDELAKQCGITLGERGGVSVNDRLQTSDPDIFAVGEVALHSGMIYGLVAPGYTMAEVVAANLVGEERTFRGADTSTKLKLMGVDVASFGDYEANPEKPEKARPLCFEDPFSGVYKKLLFSPDGQRLLGGVLVGDASDYSNLLMLSKSEDVLPCPPGELIVGQRQGTVAAPKFKMAATTQICSCNNVSYGAICDAIKDQGLTTLGEVKQCTRAGTGCGGCIPLVTSILNTQLQLAGKKVNKNLCEHFAFTRQELFQIVKIKEFKTFNELLTSHGTGHGCEICKPAVASILASLWNEKVLDRPHQTLQDTNDRFLANMQRGGLYSVVPRVPGGEITPDQLIALGQIAKKYGLYTKITGGQRVDLFGAQVQQLPNIWEEVVAAGLESGHAYGKALRTVKSCVGSTWCRYGVQDSVGFAIQVEKRYRGIRAPHKIKGAVSGCIRECAEAQSKDFGLIATEKGYNLYVCGNGGAKPRHADLLAADLDESTALKYLDRFLMFYIQTADRLTRTSVWLENMEGGIEHLREVVIHDKLGICEELERRMQYLVDTYKCEWTEVIENPERRKLFAQFVNSEETEVGIEIITERGQNRPADWPKDGALVQLGQATGKSAPHSNGRPKPREDAQPQWVPVGHVSDFPLEGGAAIKYGRVQIAVFNFTSRGQWYACQNMCPHKRAFVLSRGIIGSQGQGQIPKVACPLHKRTFSLETGECTSGDEYSVKVFPVKIADDQVYLLLPPEDQLSALLATDLHCVTACETASRCGALVSSQPALAGSS
jgi:NAD(P)H-dependent nitrite reductase large subunit/NAD(P)H-dependent nitrite reductase small subunit